MPSHVSSVSWLHCTSRTTCVAYGDGAFATERAGVWGPPQTVPLPTGQVAIAAVTCPSLTSCVVGGSDNGQAFTESETSSHWSAPQLIGGTAPYEENGDPVTGYVTSSISTLDCPTATQCVAAGSFTTAIGTPTPILSYPSGAFVTTLSGAAWSAATTIGGLSEVGGLSCPSTATCVIAGESVQFAIFSGYPVTSTSAAVASETRGVWSTASPIVGLSYLARKSGWIDSDVTGLSCTSTSCVVTGTDELDPEYDGNPVSLTDASFYGFSATDTRGAWSAASVRPRLSGVSQFACDGPTQCVAVSGATAEVLRRSTWSAPSQPLGASGHIDLVACASGSVCTAVGTIGHTTYAAATTTHGWGARMVIAGLGAPSAISCPAANECTVASGSLSSVQ